MVAQREAPQRSVPSAVIRMRDPAPRVLSLVRVFKELSMRWRSGFTLVEVLVAIVLLTVGLLGLLAGTAAAWRLVGQGWRDTRAEALGAQRLEALRAMGCGVGGGAAAEGPYTVSWTSDPLAVPLARIVVVVTSPTPRGSHADTFATVIPC